MNRNLLAPELSVRLDTDYWLLWFKCSNQYSIVSNNLKEALDRVLVTGSKAQYTHSQRVDKKESEAEWDMLTAYLDLCQTPKIDSEILSVKEVPEYSIQECVFLDILGRTIVLETDDDSTKNLLLPALSVYECPKQEEKSIAVRFTVFRKAGIIYLLKDSQLIRAVQQDAYHIIQGTFITQLLCSIQHQNLNSLLGCLHASTVVNQNTGHTIALIGNSGSGKSTLTALLAKHGYSVLADDISALTEAYNILYNPNGISIKSGAYDILKEYYPELMNLKPYKTKKGLISYLSPPTSQLYQSPCHTLVLVNYSPKGEECFEPLERHEALHILIPESWISPTPEHAKAFMDWCSHLECYKLTYHHIDTALDRLASLHKV